MNLKQILLDIFQSHQDGEQRGDTKRESVSNETNALFSLRSPSYSLDRLIPYNSPPFQRDFYLGIGAMTEYDLWRLAR